MKCKIVLEFFIVFICASLADSKPEKLVGDAELQTNFVPENLGSLSKRNGNVPTTTIRNIEISLTEKQRGDQSGRSKRKRKFEPSTSDKKAVIKANQKETGETKTDENNKELSHIEIVPKKTKAIETTGGKNREIDVQKTKADEKTGNQERVVPKELIEETKVDPKIEIIPQETKEDGKLAIKRNPKDGADNADETRESMDESIHRPKFPILKGLKKPPKIGARENLSGESNLGKAILIPKQQTTTNPCASPAIKNQLRNAADRISRLTERMNHAGFGCAVLNNEIESIKMLLQQAEVKQKEIDRTTIRDQIRERQAKIHARFGKIEFAKPKRPLLGRSKTREDDVDQSNGKIINEPGNLYET